MFNIPTPYGGLSYVEHRRPAQAVGARTTAAQSERWPILVVHVHMPSSSGRGYVTRERGRLFLAGDGSASVSFATSAVFDTERDLCLRVGVALGS
jgi:hypothetical protein